MQNFFSLGRARTVIPGQQRFPGMCLAIGAVQSIGQRWHSLAFVSHTTDRLNVGWIRVPYKEDRRGYYSDYPFRAWH